jgi:photosystem II stability/assembly factor-like uncharacterized protein
MTTPRILLLAAAIAAATGAQARPAPNAAATDAERWAAWRSHQALEQASPFHGLEWRSIGPTVQGGRVLDIEGIPGQPYGFYVSYASGGVWKTTNNGVRFEPLSDQQPTMITGDLAVDPNKPERLWVGTGEPSSARSNYGGLGIFLSEDGGKTFVHKGLADTDRIGKVWVNPTRSEHVCVAALGKQYSTGGQRGVFCSWDDGANWQQVLAGENAWTGAVDLVAQPGNPDVLYAALWERSRTPWNFVEGGVGSGIWKSTDGGRTWARLPGFPRNENVGRIGLAVSAANPDVVYASMDNQELLPQSEWDLGDRPLGVKRLRGMSKDEFLAQDPEEIENFIRGNDLDTALDAKKLIAMVKNDEVTIEQLVARLTDANAGLFNTDIRGVEVWRSDDAGATWSRRNEQPIREVVYTYGYYFGQLGVAPDDPDRVFVLGVPMVRSDDGGKTWVSNQDPDVHVDYHAVWFDSAQPGRMLVGNDGGVDVSYDGGKTWLKMDAQAVGQFYTIAVDMAEPYNVYGGLQDNGTWVGSSTRRWDQNEWRELNGGDGMYVAIDTRDNKTIYTGWQFGWYRRSDGQEIRPRPPLKDAPLRYNWATPVRLSEHNQDIVYFGANKLFRSMDQGVTWTAISADLTRDTRRGDVPFGTITTFSESPKQFGLIWVGTDDGKVWVTDDGGVEWREVDARLPRERWVSRVEASRHARERAYVSLNGYRQDDITPYLYRTDDLGRTWTSIAKGLPAEPINVVREDPENADVLYVGTDKGVYVTLDRGTTWTALQSGLPNVPVHDLVVHPRERELVAGTHGRSAWIVDVLPVQELAAVREQGVHVFAISPLQAGRGWRSSPALWWPEADMLPKLKAPVWAARDGEATIEIVDADDRVVRRITQPLRQGVNTVEWDVLVDQELALAAEQAKNAALTDPPAEGARARTPYAEAVRLGQRLYATPGKYTLRVALGEAKSDGKFEIKAPESRKPRLPGAPRVRGKDDYPGPAAATLPEPRPASRKGK